MRTVTKKELTDRIADGLGAKRTLVKEVVQRLLDEIIQELAAGNRLEFRDFGVFEVRTRKPRMAQNPRTLERVPVPLKATVKFKVGRRMKRAVGAATANPKAGASKPQPRPQAAAATDRPRPDT
ncbi:MAG: integration host factor subunit beta [Planctomycetes bacterium]|nr:integration host factor subunit beta [Planctomycetota bacterium]